MVPFDVARFRAPNFSVFDLSHDNKLDMGLGRVVPVTWEIMHPSERVQCDIGNLVRMQPLNGAILQHYDITFDSFFVPMRLIFGKEWSEKFFNLYEGQPLSGSSTGYIHGGTIVPIPWAQLLYYSKAGSVLDYLGYPTFPNLRASVVRRLNEVSVSIDGNDVGSLLDPAAVGLTPSAPTSLGNVIFTYTGFDGASKHVDYLTSAATSYGYKPYSYYGFLNKLVADARGLAFRTPSTDMDELLSVISVSPEKAFELYVDYFINWQINYPGSVTGTMLSDFFFVRTFLSNLPATEQPSSLPLQAYWRIISDWYMNYNLSNMANYELYDSIKNFVNGAAISSSPYLGTAAGLNHYIWKDWSNSGSIVGMPSGGLMDCFRRNWSNDYFTSAFRSPQSGNAQPIPSTTIPDLRRANVLQEMYERVLYAGRRYRDQVRAFFDVIPANSRLDVVEVLSREVQPLQISEVTQTNQADLDKMLDTPFGSFGGQSQTVGSHKICDYVADEHGIFMVLASIRPKAAYFQGVRRQLLKKDVFDFLWPQLENIGEQEIQNVEIFADFDSQNGPSSVAFSGTFGHQRRYGEFMYHASEVHGDLQNSLDYLHAARKFDTLPTLSVDFGEINPDNDDLNRVFVYSADERPFIVELFFDCKMVRPLSRYLNYDL